LDEYYERNKKVSIKSQIIFQPH